MLNASSIFTPALTILHVSDMHYLLRLGVRNRLRDFWHVALATAATPFSASLVDLVDGLSGHDPFALTTFMAFIVEFHRMESEWHNVPLLILDTGDATACGDMASARQAISFLERLREALGSQWHMHLYGNHDAWLDLFPAFWLFSNSRAPGDAALLSDLESCTSSPLSIPLPHGGAFVVFRTQTASTNRLTNSLARGHVSEDSFAQLKSEIRSHLGDPARVRSLRALATHHPVKYPGVRPFSMHLDNDYEVLDYLASNHSDSIHRAVHLILSGHTHSIHPKPGKLVQGTPDLYGPPFQLVSGSLSQSPTLIDRYPQQVQILRVRQCESQPEKLRIERHVATRQAASAGAFRVLEIPGAQLSTAGHHFERIDLTID